MRVWIVRERGGALFYGPIYMNESSGFGTDDHGESRFMVVLFSHETTHYRLFSSGVIPRGYRCSEI